MIFSGVADLMKKYQARRRRPKVDPLGYYMAPPAYAQMQVLEQAVEATKSLDDQKLADYIRTNAFKTVIGDIRFGKGGEWAESRVAAGAVPQHQGQRRRQFKDTANQAVVAPGDFASGTLIYPYESAK